MVLARKNMTDLSSSVSVAGAMDLRLKPGADGHYHNHHHKGGAGSDTNDEDTPPLDGRRRATADEERYDSYGAMDLSSSCSGSALEDNDTVASATSARQRSAAAHKRKAPPDSDEEDNNGEEAVAAEHRRQRGSKPPPNKRKDAGCRGINGHVSNGYSVAQTAAAAKSDEDGDDEDVVEVLNGGGVGSSRGETSAAAAMVTRNGVEMKARNVRRNIREVMSVTQLNCQAKEAQEEERRRLSRLKEVTTAAALLKQHARSRGADPDDSFVGSTAVTAAVSDTEEEEEGEEDPNNSGMHVNDALNVPNADGSVLINVGHPDRDPDIFLAPQLAACVKPHQIGGLRFLYDNIIESVSRYKESPGFGCILAHNMGLGKTLQIISFIDVFLGNTDTKKVLCIVPINTIQNWVAEFNYWLPAQGEYSGISEKCPRVRSRNFQIYVLNDSLKNLAQRGSVINSWDRTGGVLLMGYELYRQLANRRHRRKRHKAAPDHGDQDEDDQSKHILEEVQLALVNPGPDLVICDEGHRIKNSHASISQALKQIKTKRRIVLTGYPLQNNLMEYWCMVDFVRPNYLGNKTEFTNMFERPIQNGQCIDSTPKDVRLMKHRAHVLHEQLKGFVQRRSHVVLKNSLPEKTEHVLFVRLTQIQRTLYKRFMEELISNRCVSNPLKAFAVCCKIWNHPDVLYNFLKKREEIDIEFDPEEFIDKREASAVGGGVSGVGGSGPGDLVNLLTDGKKEEINYDWAQGMLDGYLPDQAENSNKLQIFLAILEECVRVGDRLLLFSQSLCTLNLIEQFLHSRTLPGQKCHWKNGVNYYRLDGSTSAQERERLINRFNADPGVALFLVSTRAGSLGVNLVGANRVVIFDASWNPCHDTQAVCRVYRYGQEKRTHIYRLVTDNSLEKKIYDRQINKQGMSDRIVDELNPDANLSSKEVHSLICDEQDDPEPADVPPSDVDRLGRNDPVMRTVLGQHGRLLTKAPVCHESQLVDRKDNRLSRAEKKLAERAYKLEKTSKITYSRPSYAAFYPKQGTFATNLHNPGSNGFTRNRYFENGKKLDNWLPAGYNNVPVTHGSHSSSSAPNTAVTSALVSPSLRATVEKSLASTVLPHQPGNKLPALNSHSPPPAQSSSIRGELPFPMPSFSNVLSAPPRGFSGPDPAAAAVAASNGDWSKQAPNKNSSTVGGNNKGDWSRQQPPMASGGITNGSNTAATTGTTSSICAARDSSVISRMGGAAPGRTASGSPPTTAQPLSAGTSGSTTPSSNGGGGGMLGGLSKQGIGIQEVKVPRELVIPTNPGEPPIRLAAGQNVLVIRTPKGMYLRMEEKIIKIKQNSTMSGLFNGGTTTANAIPGSGGLSGNSSHPGGGAPTTITIPSSGNGSSSTGTGSGTESGSESSSSSSSDNTTSLSATSVPAVKT